MPQPAADAPAAASGAEDLYDPFAATTLPDGSPEEPAQSAWDAAAAAAGAPPAAAPLPSESTLEGHHAIMKLMNTCTQQRWPKPEWTLEQLVDGRWCKGPEESHATGTQYRMTVRVVGSAGVPEMAVGGVAASGKVAKQLAAAAWLDAYSAAQRAADAGAGSAQPSGPKSPGGSDDDGALSDE